MSLADQSCERPSFSFGIIADVQYADAPNGYNFSKTNCRYYRGALEKLKIAITDWQKNENTYPSFILQMGDALDGVNKRYGKSESSLTTILETFALLKMPVYHVWGNHEYYNFTQKQLLKTALYSGNTKFSSPVPDRAYYSALPHPRLKILALDTYEVSMLASVEGSEEYKLAQKYLEINQNEDKNSGDGLEGENRRFKKFNGGLSESQILWIEKHLQDAVNNRQNVIIIGHCAVYEPASSYECLCLNAPEVLALFHKYSQCIVAYFAGHDHTGGQAVDDQGIMHLTLPGVIENDEECDFGTVYVYSDRMEIEGKGRVPESLSTTLRYALECTENEVPTQIAENQERTKVIACSSGL